MTVVSAVNARYRLWQFWQALWAGPLPAAAQEQVKAVLSTAEVNLFEQYSASDQWHAYRVLRLLQEAGYREPSLLKAALLHDVGKVKFPIKLWDRVLVVILNIILPQQSKQWELGPPIGWQRPFVIKARHAEWGAEMVRAAGSDPLTISLIRRHQDLINKKQNDVEGRYLRILQWADNQA